MVGDILALEGHDKPGEPLIQPVMQGGRRLRPPETLADIRQRAKRELERLPEPLRRLEPNATFPVEVADELVKLAAEVDRRLQSTPPA
jgi:nicotinate phosphoribosyltransferase